MRRSGSLESRFAEFDGTSETRKHERKIIFDDESDAGARVIEAREDVVERLGDVAGGRERRPEHRGGDGS